jgi:hypothetical protein
VERAAFACEYLLRGGHAYQGAAGAMISKHDHRARRAILTGAAFAS